MRSTVHDIDTDHSTYSTRSRVSWGPILMGAVAAVGLQTIFTVLGIAVGATVGDATASTGTSAQTLGIAAAAWWLISGTIALAFGGFVLGRLSGLSRALPLSLEAVAMWSVVAVFGFLVLWSGAGMLSQAASPFAAMAAPSINANVQPSTRGEPMNATNASSTVRPVEITSAQAEEARRATRTASWWAVVGLLAGVGATIAGANMGASDYPRTRPETH